MKMFAVLMVALLAAGAWAADTVVSPTYHGPYVPEKGTDATRELSWDTGTITNAVAWYTGAGAWGGVDFNISTIATYKIVESGKIYYYPNWPNGTFEGNRMGVWSFSGGVPGSLLNGPTYVRGTASGWNTYANGYNLGSATAFVMAFEQYYNYPACDTVINMSSSGTASHSWYYYSGAWAGIAGLGYGSYPLMTRAIMSDLTGVTPTSFGRVKAMYQ